MSLWVEYGLTFGNKMTINFNAIDQTTTGFRLNPSEASALDAGVVGHEGAHLGRGGILTEFFLRCMESTKAGGPDNPRSYYRE